MKINNIPNIYKLIWLLPKICHTKLFFLILYIALFLYIFSLNFVTPIDPDLGWHLRYGEEVVKNHNILKVDTFSHTVVGQTVIDTEWLVEAVFYIIFSKYYW